MIPAAQQTSSTGRAGRNRTVAGVWVGGIALIALVDLIGPDRFIGALPHLGQWLVATVQDLTAMLVTQAYDLVRASALGLFGVFVVLSVIGGQRGLPVARRLVVVTVTYLLFLAPALNGDHVSSDRWLGALLLSAVAAFAATRRLSQAAPPSAP